MRVLCLVDGPVIPPDKWMWNHLPEYAQSDQVDFLHVTTQDVFQKWGKLLNYYPAYWSLAWRAVQQSRQERYDLIIAWESKNGFLLAALRSWLRVQQPPLVILAFSFKGIATRLVGLSRLVMRGVNHALVLSPGEVDYYHHLLHFPREQIHFCPLGWHDIFASLKAQPFTAPEPYDYIFASGRSYRDYRTLFEAAASVEARFVVNARRFNVRNLTCPPNLKINEFMPVPEFARLMLGARFVVVPLQATPHAAGEGHIIQAMSAGKALVATRTASTAYYVADGETGILVKPHDVEAMRAAINHLLTHPAEAQAMGQRARQHYEERFTAEISTMRQYEVLRQVVTTNSQAQQTH